VAAAPFPSVFKEGWPRDQEKIAKHPQPRGRVGFQGTAAHLIFSEIINHLVCTAESSLSK